MTECNDNMALGLLSRRGCTNSGGQACQEAEVLG